MAKSAAEVLEEARKAAAARKSTEERLAEAKAAREEKLAAQKAARPDARTAMAAKAEAARDAMGRAAAERAIAENMRGAVDGRSTAGVVGSSIAMWMYDPVTGKKRTPQEIVDAVVEAVLADKDAPRGQTLDPLTGKPRPSTDLQMVEGALAQLLANANREGNVFSPALEVAQLLGGDSRAATTKALANRTDLWVLGKETVGTIIDRKNFDDAYSVKRFVVDPTKRKLTPEQLKQFKAIGAAGGQAINPITGAALMIDANGGYTLGEEPTGDITGIDLSTYQGRYTPPNYTLGQVGGSPDSLGTGGTGGTGGTVGGVTPKPQTAEQIAAIQKSLTEERQRQSIITILQDRFAKYGLASLANKIKELAIDGATEATITLGLQSTDEFKQRFSANEIRVKNGLSFIQPGEYLNLEDGYRQVLRSYGLKAFDNDAYVQQFIANDVSAAELSNRVVTAVQRVQNADPAVSKQLRDFYGIGSQDLVAYVLDPQQQFQKIERQVAASEIGVAAGRQGLTVGVGVAEQLAAQGVSQAEAQKGYATIADILPTAEKLSAIYGQTTGTTYGQSEAEQEVFNSLASAQRARQKLTALEVAQFGGSSGLSKAALSTQNKGNF
jgi:hypothetical protein